MAAMTHVVGPGTTTEGVVRSAQPRDRPWRGAGGHLCEQVELDAPDAAEQLVAIIRRRNADDASPHRVADADRERFGGCPGDESCALKEERVALGARRRRAARAPRRGDSGRERDEGYAYAPALRAPSRTLVAVSVTVLAQAPHANLPPLPAIIRSTSRPDRLLGFWNPPAGHVHRVRRGGSGRQYEADRDWRWTRGWYAHVPRPRMRCGWGRRG